MRGGEESSSWFDPHVCRLALLHSCKNRMRFSLLPLSFRDIFSCPFGDTEFEPHIRLVSVSTAAFVFTMLFSVPPNHAVVFCSLWCSAPSQTPGQPSPPAWPKSCRHCHRHAGFRGGGGLEGYLFLHCLNPQFLIAPLNEAGGGWGITCSIKGFRLIRANVFWWPKGQWGRPPFPV